MAIGKIHCLQTLFLLFDESSVKIVGSPAQCINLPIQNLYSIDYDNLICN